MWFADIFCDLEWIAERQGVLGPCRFRLSGARSVSLGIAIELLFFGDDTHLRHVRVLMHTDSKDAADRCINMNVQTWVASVEAAVMMATQRPFHVVHLPGPQQFAVATGEGDETTPALVMVPQYAEGPALNYEGMARCVAVWGGESAQHLFYFRRFVDESLPLDVRWLNGYRLLEWHFLRGGSGLQKSREWVAFVSKFSQILASALRPRQDAVGLLEEARALAAHAGIDKRSDAERTRDPRNAMEKTFRILEQMVIAALNEEPTRTNAGIQFLFQPPESESPASE